MKFLTSVFIITSGTKTMQTPWLKNTRLKRAWGIKYIVMWSFILSSSSSLWDHQVPHKAGFGTVRYHFTRCLLDLWVSKWVSNEYKSILDLWVSNEYPKPSLTIQKWKLHSTFHENVEVNGHLLAYKIKKINCKNYPDSNAISLTSVEQSVQSSSTEEVCTCKLQNIWHRMLHLQNLVVTDFLLLFHLFALIHC